MLEGEQEVDTEDRSEVDMANAIDSLWKRFRSLDFARKKTTKK